LNKYAASNETWGKDMPLLTELGLIFENAATNIALLNGAWFIGAMNHCKCLGPPPEPGGIKRRLL
jgi:hypothetical protein